MAEKTFDADSALKLAKLLIASFHEARAAISAPELAMDTQKVHDLLAAAREAVGEHLDVPVLPREFATHISRESTLLAFNMRIRLLGTYVVELRLSQTKGDFRFDAERARKEIAAAATDIDVLLATPTFGEQEDWGGLIDGSN